jgi:DNA-directed RNA polymerase specialized sigma24 family protein
MKTNVPCGRRAIYWDIREPLGYKGPVSMESSTKSPFLDQFGNPLPERIQHVLDDLTVTFRSKFRMIRDDVVAVDILEQAGRQIMDHEADNGAAENLHGLAWVTIRNVAVSRLRRGPHLLEQAIARSAKSAAAVSRLRAVEGSPKRIENSIFLREVLDHLTARERKIAIWKKGEYSSQFIAEKLGMSVPSVDSAYSRLREKARRMVGRGRRLGL